MATNARRVFITIAFAMFALLLVPFFIYGWPLIAAAFTPGRLGVSMGHEQRVVVAALLLRHSALVHAYTVAVCADLLAIVISMCLHKNVAMIVGGVFCFLVLPLAFIAPIWWPIKAQAMIITFAAMGVGFLLFVVAAIAALIWVAKLVIAGATASRPARPASVGVVHTTVETPHAYDGTGLQ